MAEDRFIKSGELTENYVVSKSYIWLLDDNFMKYSSSGFNAYYSTRVKQVIDASIAEMRARESAAIGSNVKNLAMWNQLNKLTTKLGNNQSSFANLVKQHMLGQLSVHNIAAKGITFAKLAVSDVKNRGKSGNYNSVNYQEFAQLIANNAASVTEYINNYNQEMEKLTILLQEDGCGPAWQQVCALIAERSGKLTRNEIASKASNDSLAKDILTQIAAVNVNGAIKPGMVKAELLRQQLAKILVDADKKPVEELLTLEQLTVSAVKSWQNKGADVAEDAIAHIVAGYATGQLGVALQTALKNVNGSVTMTGGLYSKLDVKQSLQIARAMEQAGLANHAGRQVKSQRARADAVVKFYKNGIDLNIPINIKAYAKYLNVSGGVRTYAIQKDSPIRRVLAFSPAGVTQKDTYYLSNALARNDKSTTSIYNNAKRLLGLINAVNALSGSNGTLNTEDGNFKDASLFFATESGFYSISYLLEQLKFGDKGLVNITTELTKEINNEKICSEDNLLLAYVRSKKANGQFWEIPVVTKISLH